MKTFKIEKDLVIYIKNYLKKNNLTCFKTHGNLYQQGLPDLIVFNKNIGYGLEVKKNLNKNKPSKLQISTAKQMRNNFIYLFIDENNYQTILNSVINNDITVLSTISNIQIDYYLLKYETVI